MGLVARAKSSLGQGQVFTTEVVDEVRKVTWPDWPQLKNATLVIIVFVLIVAVIIWVMDFGVRNLVAVVLDLFAG